MNRSILSAALVLTGALSTAACAAPATNPSNRVAINPSHKGGAVVTVAPPRPVESEQPYALTGKEAAVQPETRKAVRYEPIWVGSRQVGVRAVDEVK